MTTPSTNDPRLAEALSLVKEGRFAEAKATYRALMAEGREEPLVLGNLASLEMADGRESEARALLERSLALQPRQPEALRSLAQIRERLGKAEEALLTWQAFVDLAPEDLQGWMRLGLCQRACRLPEAAMVSYYRALALEPEHAEALFQIGVNHQAQGRHDLAIEPYRRALELAPDHPGLLNNLGVALDETGEHEAAVLQYVYLLTLVPDHAEGQFNLGNALGRIGETEQAIEAYRKSIALAPDQVSAHVNLGNVYKDAGRLEEAVAVLEEALRHHPRHARLWCNLGGLHQLRGNLNGAIEIYRRAVGLDPADVHVNHALFFALSISSDHEPQAIIEANRDYLHARSSLLGPVGGPLGEQSPKSARAAASPAGATMRIGILTAELSGHCVSLFLDSFLKHHDRDRFSIELISTVAHRQERTEILCRKASHSFLVDPGRREQAQELIVGRAYDLILDTSGYTASTGIDLLVERLAPVQGHYIGFHATTGLETIDVFIGDQEVTPVAFDEQFTERVLRLPRPWLACSPFGPLPRARWEGTWRPPVLGCFAQLAKMGEATIEFWAEALRLLPEARLALKDKTAVDPSARKRIRDALERRGVAPGRVGFLPRTGSWQEHLAHYNAIDIALDTTPWSSATTAFDAVGMGVPLVAIRGDRMAARMSSSVLRGLEREEWICESPAAFAATVALLAADANALREARGRLQEEALASCLFDGRDLTDHLQDALARL